MSRAASWSSSRLCSIHCFPLETQLSHIVEFFANMHRTFRLLHSKQLRVPFLMLGALRASVAFGWWGASSVYMFLCVSDRFQTLVREGQIEKRPRTHSYSLRSRKSVLIHPFFVRVIFALNIRLHRIRGARRGSSVRKQEVPITTCYVHA